VPWADVIRSNSKSGESLVFIILKDYTPKKEVPEAWYQVRKKIGDIRHTFPAGSGAVHQRRVRRHLHQHLRADRRRLRPRACARRPTASRANCARCRT
jgi:hypothetical protein